MESAKKEALTAISLMETLAEAIGWKLDYTALKIDPQTEKDKLL